MVVLRTLFHRFASVIPSSTSSTRPVVNRAYSMWPPHFEEPIENKQYIPELVKSGEYDKKKYLAIKAAKNDASCSLWYDEKVNKFLNLLMQHGNKELGMQQLRLVYKHIKDIQVRKALRAPPERRELIETNPTVLIRRAIENARPMMNIEKVRVGSVQYQVPTPITEKRSEFEGMRWLLEAARDRDRKAKMFAPVLAEEIIDCAGNHGRVVSKKNEWHRVCEQNRAYAHYRRSK